MAGDSRRSKMALAPEVVHRFHEDGTIRLSSTDDSFAIGGATLFEGLKIIAIHVLSNVYPGDREERLRPREAG